jgi:nitroreductase
MSETQTSSNPSAETLSEVLRSRRTIHTYSERVPETRLIYDAVEHARWAPNHHHTEPWRFYLIDRTVGYRIAELNAELVRQKSGEEAAQNKLRRWREMPGWLAVTCAKNADAAREREDYAACCCAVQNLTLYLWAHGVGMKWGTGKVTRDPRFLAMLGADPATEFTVGLFWYGYPTDVPTQVRRPVSEILRVVSES